MRLAVLGAHHDGAAFAAIRTELDIFNIDVISLPSICSASQSKHVGELPEAFVERMLDELTLRGPWDGALLVLSDAIRAARRPGHAGCPAERVRRILGPKVPVGTVDRVHANASKQLLAGLTMLWRLHTLALDPTAGPSRR